MCTTYEKIIYKLLPNKYQVIIKFDIMIFYFQ